MNRPHAVIHNLFEDSILDLSWRADKHVLLACSTDGTVACVIFSEEELGITLSQDEKVRSPQNQCLNYNLKNYYFSVCPLQENVWRSSKYGFE